DDAHVLGQVGIQQFDNPRRRHVANIGLGVAESARGRGVGSALVAAAIDPCGNWLGVTRIELETYPDNTAAIALFKRQGFQLAGTACADAFRNGEYVDVHLMAWRKD